MSYAFITAIKQDPKQSYVELLNSIRDILETKYSQKPQLSCSHPLGMPFESYLLEFVLIYIPRHEYPLCDVSKWSARDIMSGVMRSMA